MDIQIAYDTVAQGALVAGMRGAFPPETALRVTSVLMEEGVNVFEFMMNSEQPLEAMQAVKREYGDDACVGMGTVLDTDTAQRVLDAGADFIVSPAFQPEVVKVVMTADVLMAPGVATPSEAVAAWDMGVKLLKLFPIGALGVPYFKAMFGPLNHMRFMCNGAINAENTRQFIEAGAVACGIGSWLVGDGTLPEESLRVRAKQIKAAINAARGIAQAI